MLGRRCLFQLQAGGTSQFARGLLDDDAELLSEGPCVCLRKIPRGTNAQFGQVLGHAVANAPHVADIARLQQPVTSLRIANIEHASRFSLPLLGTVVGEFAQRLAGCDTNANGNAGTAQDLGADLAAEPSQVAWQAGQVGEGLIDAVNLDCRAHLLKDGHDALAYVPVQRIVRAEGEDSMPAQFVADLEVRLAHLDEGLCVCRSGDNAAIVVRQYNDRSPG
ncbi:hypothetical protein D3C81_1568410 [compost metagenome]